MNIILIVLLVLCSLLLFIFLIRKKPYTAIVTSGLSNRLRTILPLHHLNNKINVWWSKDRECNGHFLEAFQPIENINFISFVNAIPPDFIGQKTFDKIIGHNDPELEKQCYSLLKLKPDIQDTVDTFIKDHNIINGIALHVRRTDFVKDVTKVGLYKEDSDYYKYIDSFPMNTPVFLATDNSKTQKQYMDRYPNIVVHKIINSTGKMRQTSFVDSVIDVFICSKANEFMGTPYSSYSGLIEILRQIY